MKWIIGVMAVGFAAVLVLAQQPIPAGSIIKDGSDLPTIAVPDLRGSGEAQGLMGTFNQTLWDDINGGGVVKLVSKSMYPPSPPQQPSDITQAPAPVAPPRGRTQKKQPEPPRTGGGRWLSDWSGPPPNARYLAFGYTGVTNGVLVLRGWLYDVTNPAKPEIFYKNYSANMDSIGATKVAHEFAADILAQFGGQSLYGTHIYFVSNRSGHKEIWAMDADGKNQRQITRFNSVSIEPSLSPDGTKIAFTTFARTTPGIFVFSVDPVRDLRFYNQRASVNSSPSFTPDGKQIIYSSSAGGSCCRIFLANLDGANFRPLTSATKVETEPKVNPKTGSEILFVSGRSGPPQIYKMNIDGADVERLTDGSGDAANPSWHPNGQVMAFAWTRGYAIGGWNVFWMDIASRKYVQLTSGAGKNENPVWAPSGTHLVFGSTRSGKSQIYSMRADGTDVRQLTTAGENTRPVWGK